MGVFLVYLLKSALCLTSFYVFYRWILGNETFHRFNRLFLLVMMMLSWLIPMCELTSESASEINRAMWTLDDWWLMIESNRDLVSGQLGWDIRHLSVGGLFYLYIIGGLFFLYRYYCSWKKMYSLLTRCHEEKLENGIQLLLHQEDAEPFSWMHFIVMSEKDRKANGEAILTHEYAHVRNKHSWDLMFMDVCILFQWFNPVAWLLKKELQNTHEYEADEYVVGQGVDSKKYQLLLIEKAVGTRLYSMANSLNHSSLKKRITMMIKKKSNPWARLKYFGILPVVAISMVAFARPEISDKLSEISKVKVSELTSNAKAVGDKKVKNVSESLKKRPLVIVDGVKKDWSYLEHLNSETIEAMYVWKGEEAIAKFGDSGNDGVIEIKLKKGE